jgi:hypothetical protein
LFLSVFAFKCLRFLGLFAVHVGLVAAGLLPAAFALSLVLLAALAWFSGLILLATLLATLIFARWISGLVGILILVGHCCNSSLG